MGSDVVTKRFGHDERELVGNRRVLKVPLKGKDTIIEHKGMMRPLCFMAQPCDEWEFVLYYEAEIKPSEVYRGKMKVSFIGTGQPVPDAMYWIGSCQHNGLVWHLYYEWV